MFYWNMKVVQRVRRTFLLTCRRPVLFVASIKLLWQWQLSNPNVFVCRDANCKYDATSHLKKHFVFRSTFVQFRIYNLSKNNSAVVFTFLFKFFWGDNWQLLSLLVSIAGRIFFQRWNALLHRERWNKDSDAGCLETNGFHVTRH